MVHVVSLVHAVSLTPHAQKNFKQLQQVKIMQNNTGIQKN
jgi:hypothetical protein